MIALFAAVWLSISLSGVEDKSELDEVILGQSKSVTTYCRKNKLAPYYSQYASFITDQQKRVQLQLSDEYEPSGFGDVVTDHGAYSCVRTLVAGLTWDSLKVFKRAEGAKVSEFLTPPNSRQYSLRGGIVFENLSTEEVATKSHEQKTWTTYIQGNGSVVEYRVPKGYCYFYTDEESVNVVINDECTKRTIEIFRRPK
ncbi:MAG: hypothetical protein J0L72_07740 [Armatimonadetes bacterium]|nr:hypothetical protein [Armatimonadota bacterium]